MNDTASTPSAPIADVSSDLDHASLYVSLGEALIDIFHSFEDKAEVYDALPVLRNHYQAWKHAPSLDEKRARLEAIGREYMALAKLAKVTPPRRCQLLVTTLSKL